MEDLGPDKITDLLATTLDADDLLPPESAEEAERRDRKQAEIRQPLFNKDRT
ncbi:hypothetical protein [Paenibacillus silviterrae]|uniref:hypothetical protein n=1 Tax=Paenibacillus silviterrae TaxID=3242194 RepID=UPI002543C800|nr:hypothetical protein [Paenibacillus chinjuensis]